jgi:hypothetical protein
VKVEAKKQLLSLRDLILNELMTDHIEPGNKYLLDGKLIVKVIKSLNRSNTVFSVETTQQSILTVEKDRLHPMLEKLEEGRKAQQTTIKAI